MNSELQRRAEEIFSQAIEKPAGPRTEFISRRCDGDAALEAEVRMLLKFATEAGDAFLNPQEIREVTVAGSGVEEPLENEPRLAPGTKVSSYTIRGVLGAGGMGMVYLADQERPKRTVALKVIRRGMGTSGILRRFEHEADVLGRLHHPGIAQIFEAGTSTVGGVSQPFIAMEYVDGPTIAAYAERKGLTTRDRLRLIADVCDAVHHAHQRGFIHRDLKPGNILVNESGQPKILDFGVARAVSTDINVTTMRTSVGQLIGTLAYMSPEQVIGERSEIDTRSDVYAVGVMLYELLAGRLPHDLTSCSLPEAARAIRHDPPKKLSTVSRVFRGEIETIVSKALEKDKSRRYQSAADLGMDLRRYLAGEPIHARQDSAMYVLRKQFKRHKWSFAAAVAAILCLVGFSIYAGINSRRQTHLAKLASDARKDAFEQRDKAREFSGQLQEQLKSAGIERGRLEAAVGNLALAEDFLWPAYLQNPDLLSARWALWDLERRAPALWTVACENGGAVAIATPDRKHLVLGMRTGELIIYSTADGHQERRFKAVDGSIASMSVAPDSAAVVVGMTGGRAAWVSLAETDDKKATRYLGEGAVHTTTVYATAISSDGNLIATGGDSKIRLWNAKTLAPIKDWSARDSQVSALAFSHKGDRLASGTRVMHDNVAARLWNIEDTMLMKNLEWAAALSVSNVSFESDDSALILGARDGNAQRYSFLSDKVETFSAVCNYGILPPVMSPDGSKMLIVGGEMMHIFPGGSLKPLRTFGKFRSIIQAATWIDDSTVVMLSSDGAIHAIDVSVERGARRIKGFRSWTFDVQFSPDGRRFAMVGDGELRVMHTDTLGVISTMAMPMGPGMLTRARCIRFLKDSRTIVMGGNDGAVRIIDSDTAQVTDIFKSALGEVYSIAIDPQERIVAAGHSNGVIELWDLPERKVRAKLAKQARRIEGMTFTRDGLTLISSGPSGAIQVWDVASGAARERLETSADAWNVAFSPDYSQLLVSTFEGAIEVFDGASFTRLATLLGHGRLVPGLTFSADGKYFATCGEDGSVKIWETATRRVLVTLVDPDGASLVGIAFDPSGRYLAASSSREGGVIYDLSAMDACIDGNVAYQRQRLKIPAPMPTAPATADTK